MFVYKHGYQSEDTAISGIITKVKGVSFVNNSNLTEDYQGVWDIQSLVVPPMVRNLMSNSNYMNIKHGFFLYLKFNQIILPPLLLPDATLS